MSTLSIPTPYADGTTLYQSQLDGIAAAVETFVNTTGLDDDNIQNNGITGSDKLVDGSITTAKLNDSAVTTAKINDSAVTTAKINDSAVTTAKINDSAVTTAKINASAVTTAKINDAAVTRAKQASVGEQNSSEVTSFSTTSTSYTDVTSLSASITTSGRPVVALVTSSGSGSGVGAQFNAGTTGATLKLLRDSTDLGEWNQSVGIIPVNLMYVDSPSSGTYTYKIQLKSTTGANVSVTRVKLQLYEL